MSGLLGRMFQLVCIQLVALNCGHRFLFATPLACNGKMVHWPLGFALGAAVAAPQTQTAATTTTSPTSARVLLAPEIITIMDVREGQLELWGPKSNQVGEPLGAQTESRES